MLRQLSKLWQGGEPNDDQKHWDAALRILQKIDPRLVMTRLSLTERMAAWVRFWLGRVGFANQIDGWLNAHRRNAFEVSAGVAVPLKKKEGEDRAFEIQVRVLEYAIQLRKAAHGRYGLVMHDLPQDQESEKERARRAGRGSRSKEPNIGSTVRDFIVRIQEDTIPSEAQKDIVADYWSKLAFVAWEQAKRDGAHSSGPWLKQARKYINIALEGRPNWTPAQFNLARITALEGNEQKALEILEKVMGKKKAAVAAPAQSPPSNSDAIADLILKMSVERDSKAIARHIERSFGVLPRDTVRKVTQTLAGKVDARLLNDILRKVPVAGESRL